MRVRHEYLSRLLAGIRDIAGGRSDATQKVLRDSRKTVLILNELRKEAHSIGANAVIGVDMDYSEFSGGKSMPFLVASGTAVIADTQNTQSQYTSLQSRQPESG